MYHELGRLVSDDRERRKTSSRCHEGGFYQAGLTLTMIQQGWTLIHHLIHLFDPFLFDPIFSLPSYVTGRADAGLGIDHIYVVSAWIHC